MRLFCIAIALLSCRLLGRAQTPIHFHRGRITGRILDSATHHPIEYATISLFAQDSAKPLNGTTTNDKGVFQLNGLTEGIFMVRIGFIGYADRRVGPLHISEKTPTLLLGDLPIGRKAASLQTVVVTAPSNLVENKIDKMVYNAEKDITSQGGVATDVLKKVPMVSVDVDGNVELQGNANILFLIDGKPSSIFGNNLADALQSIPASQIKSIEVITSPGAKYDAEGTGGIINIILKENKARGVNGNLSLSAGSRLENGSLNLDARKDNIGVHAFFSGNGQLSSRTLNSTDRLSEDTSGGTGISDHLVQQGSSDFSRGGYETGLSMDWDLKPRNNLTASVGYDHFGNRSAGYLNQEETQTGIPTGNNISDISSLLNTDNGFHAQSLDWSLRYKKTYAREDKELDLSYDGSYGKNNSYVNQQLSAPQGDSVYSGSNNYNTGKDQETNFRLDFTQPLNNGMKLETGARVQIRDITSNSSVYTLDPASSVYVYDSSQSNALNYERRVFAGYASLSKPFGKRLESIAGLRYERTETDASFSGASETSIPGYNIFAPSLILSYALPNDQTLKIAYTKRIQRPNYRNLNPFVNTSDPKNISTGNPYLDPEIHHGIELTYSRALGKGASMNMVLFYHRSDHDIQPYVVYEPSYRVGDSVYSNVSVTSPVNIGSENDYGSNLYGSVPIGSKINLRTNLFFFYRYITAGNLPGSAGSSFNLRMNMNATYEITNGMTLECFGNFNSPRSELQGHYPSFTSYTLALRKQLWNKKGSLALTATNPFAKNVDQRTEVTGQGLFLNSLREIPFRSVNINFTWKFGKLEFKKPKEEEKENDLSVPTDPGQTP